MKKTKFNLININNIDESFLTIENDCSFFVMVDDFLEMSNNWKDLVNDIDFEKNKNNDVIFLKNDFFSSDKEWQMIPIVRKSFFKKYENLIRSSNNLVNLNLEILSNNEAMYSYHYALDDLFKYTGEFEYFGKKHFEIKHVNTYALEVAKKINDIKITFSEKMLLGITTYNLSREEFKYWKEKIYESNSELKIFLIHDNKENYIDTKNNFSGIPFIEMHFNYKNNFKLVSFLDFLITSNLHLLDNTYYIKIMDPDDFIDLNNTIKIRNTINGLKNSYSGIVHKGTKIKKPNKWKEFIVETIPKLYNLISYDPHWASTFGNFQLIYNIQELSIFYKQNFKKIPNIKYHDDRFLSFIMINSGKLLNIDISFYIQFHAKGQTKIVEKSNNKTELETNELKSKKLLQPWWDLKETYDFFANEGKYFIPYQTAQFKELIEKNIISENESLKYLAVMDKKSIWDFVVKYEEKILTIVTTLAKKDIITAEAFFENIKQLSERDLRKRVNLILVYRIDNIDYSELILKYSKYFDKIINSPDKNVKKIGKLMIAKKYVNSKYVKFHDPDDLILWDGVERLVDFLSTNNSHYISATATMLHNNEETEYPWPGTNAVSVFRSDVYKNYKENRKWKYDELFSEDTFRFISWLIYFESKFGEEISFDKFSKHSSMKYIINSSGISSDYMFRTDNGHVYNFESKEWEHAKLALISLSNLISQLDLEIDLKNNNDLVVKKLNDLIRMVYMYLINCDVSINEDSLGRSLHSILKKYIHSNNIDENDYRKIVFENNQKIKKMSKN